MRLLIVGTGYVGLVSGTCFAEMGHHVTCLDINQEKIDLLNKGIIPIYEPFLEELVKKNQKDKRLFFTTEYAEALKNVKVVFLAVDTPPREDGSSNTSSLERAVLSIVENMSSEIIFVNKSTAPVGTAHFLKDFIEKALKKKNSSLSFDVASNPEFLKEGCAIADFMKPDRVILGVFKESTKKILQEIYRPFMLSQERVFLVDPKSAEMIKYAANAMLALRISFMNELSGLCELMGADIDNVRKGIGSDHRIGPKFLYPGPGFGGSCFPKDIASLAVQSKNVSYPTPLLDAIQTVNSKQKKVLYQKIKSYFLNKGGLQGKTVALLGIAFKPDTDDIREAPSLSLIEDLLKEKVSLRLFDPAALGNIKAHLADHPSIFYAHNEEEACQGVDAIALVTEWKQFRFLDFESLLKNMKGNAFFDGRNQYKGEEMKALGFNYFSIGKKPYLQSEL